MRPLHGSSPSTVIVASLGLVILLSEATRLAIDSHAIWLPPFLNDRIVLLRTGEGEAGLTALQLGNAAIMLGLVAVGHGQLAGTAAGRIWRAVCDDPGAAQLCGVNAGAVFTLSYLAAALIACICSVLATSYYGTMDFGSGMLFGLKVVLIAAVGGQSAPLRSALGAALYGLAEALWGAYLPLAWREMALFGGLVLLAVVFRREARI